MSTLTGRTIRCILFDFGSTLWIHEERAASAAQRRTARQHALTLLRQHVPEHFFSASDTPAEAEHLFKVIDQRIYERYLLNTNVEPDFATIIVDTLQEMGLPRVDRVVGAAMFEALRVRSYGSRILFPDTLTTLDALQERGFLLGVVTNRQYGGPLFLEDVRSFGLLKYFQPHHMAISADLGIRKPNPDIFLHALNALDVRPEEAVMVGDSLGADIVGAKKLHIATAWKPNSTVFARARAAQEQEGNTRMFESRLFEFGRQYEDSRGRAIPLELEPDLIIEHLSELLDVFVAVGKQ